MPLAESLQAHPAQLNLAIDWAFFIGSGAGRALLLSIRKKSSSFSLNSKALPAFSANQLKPWFSPNSNCVLASTARVLQPV